MFKFMIVKCYEFIFRISQQIKLSTSGTEIKLTSVQGEVGILTARAAYREISLFSNNSEFSTISIVIHKHINKN